MKICFIGGGNMAAALIAGLLAKQLAPETITVVEISEEHCQSLRQRFGITATTDLPTGITSSAIVVLAMKPQQLQPVARRLAGLIGTRLLVSIAAGIRAADIARWAATRNVIRAMPNTPALVGLGVTGLFALPEVTAEGRTQATRILDTVGKTVWVRDEAQLDAVTALSGSGPAYVFYFIEALQQAGGELGMNEADAKRLILETFKGAAALAEASEEDVSVLRARVTSKNGTTERALLHMEASGVKAAIAAGALAAAARSRELGDELGRDAT